VLITMRAKPPLENRIRELESDLALTRTTVIELMGPKFQAVLHPPSSLDTHDALHRWYENAVENVLELTEIAAVTDPLGGTRRSACPLCGAEARNFYEQGPGFRYPEGLRRHLHGTHRSIQCAVIKAALGLALSRFDRHERFGR
jgi:hypothetical protein